MTLPKYLFLLLLLMGAFVRSAVAALATGDTTGTSYAINLASSQSHFTPDDLPRLEVLQANRVYTTVFRKDGITWQRLRVGIFESLPEAKAARAGLEAHYPDAWIAEVSPAERRASRETVLGMDVPGDAAIPEVAMQVTPTEPSAGNPDRVRGAVTSVGHVLAETATTGSEAANPPVSEWLSLAGAEYGDDNAYYYAGLLVPFPGSDLGNGFVQRYWLDWLEYEYDNATDTVRARAPGASVALGYGRAAAEGAWSAYLGAVWRDTDLSPDDPGSDVRGTQWGLNIGLQGDRRLGDDWHVNGIASFTTGTSSYWTRGRLTRRLASGYTPGLELVLHGNDDYSAWQAGIVILDIRLAAQTLLGLKGGARKNDSQSTGGYFGIELAHAF